MINALFDSAQFQTLSQGTNISDTIDVNGMYGYLITNVSPYFFYVLDDGGRVVAFVSPWTTVTGSLTQATQRLTIKSDVTKPIVSVSGAPYTSWAFEYELSVQQQPAQVTQLSIATAANVTVQGNMEISGGTVDANIQGTPTFNIAAGASVEVNNATIDTNSTILNEYVSTNPLVPMAKGQVAANIPAGTNQFVADMWADNPANYDEFFLAIYSPGNIQYTPTIGNASVKDTITNNQYFYTSLSMQFAELTNGGSARLWKITPSTDIIQKLALFLQTPSGVAANETITYELWGHYSAATQSKKIIKLNTLTFTGTALANGASLEQQVGSYDFSQVKRVVFFIKLTNKSPVGSGGVPQLVFDFNTGIGTPDGYTMGLKTPVTWGVSTNDTVQPAAQIGLGSAGLINGTANVTVDSASVPQILQGYDRVWLDFYVWNTANATYSVNFTVDVTMYLYE